MNRIVKFHLLNGLILLILISLAGCKKQKDPEPTYDTTNRVLRIKVSPNGTPFNLILSQVNESSSTDFINTVQNSGQEFNYGYTPPLGGKITVTIESIKPISCYVYFKGKYTWKIDLTLNTNGKYSGTFNYNVSE